ncbi:outer membrane protein assembly factor BamB family protein [Desulforegula conservatrix]|uniref:outer membrane protein assembly factor BamB family protein n=1 Tax=Desulforegula conservatrix TaxID=153026 RepID=UPI0004274ED7|nr:PQQ-binding-like beta-propeller repeat protein [Desulforegula conservatrix]
MKLRICCEKLFLLFVVLFIFGCNSSGGSGAQDGRDTDAPSVPANLSAFNSDSVVQISWAASTGDTAVTGYKIYRNGVYLASSSTTSYTDSDITTAKQYCYTVSALDSSGNESASSVSTCVDTSNGRVKWRFRLESHIKSDLAMAGDGTVYASDGSFLYAINPDGNLKWKYSPDVEISSPPVVTNDGSICFKTELFLYVLKTDGTLKWKFETSRINSYDSYQGFIASSTDGTIYAVASDSLYAINQDGTLKWQVSGQASNIAIDQGGSIYTQSYGYGLRSFFPDGTPKWQQSSYGTAGTYQNASSPVIGSKGTVLVSVHHDYAHGVPEYNNFYALKSDGTELWQNSTDRIFGTPVTGADGTIYACTHTDGGNVLVCALNEDGTPKWKSDANDYIMRSLTVDADGTVYIMTTDGYMNVIGNDGALKWKSQTGASYSSPAIANDGTIYVGSLDGFIYAISSDSPGLASGSWSRPLGDNLNSCSLMEKKADTVPPSDPVNVTASATASSMIKIDWDASIDSLNPVTGYKVFRNGEYIGLKGRNFTDSGLNYSTKYCYQISAVDAAGNESAKSPEICATPLQPTEGVLKWKYRTNGVPSIGQDSSIIVWSDYSRFALNPDGSVRWSYPTGVDGYRSSIGSDGSIYTGEMLAFYPNGNEKWRYEDPSAYASPSISSNGILYVPGDNAFWAVNPDGSLKWKYEEDNSGGYLVSFRSSSIASDGTIYSPSYSGFMYAFNPDGSVKWKYQTDIYAYYNDSPAIGPDGTVYATDYENGLLAINSDGTLKWKIKPDDTTMDFPVIGSDGTIYSNGTSGYFYAISPAGQIKWRYHDSETNFFNSTVIGADGTLYAGTSGGNLLALRPDGTLKWKYKAGTGSINPFAITSDGTLYFGAQGSSATETGFLCAIQTSSMGLASGGWPKIHHDNQNTGRMP